MPANDGTGVAFTIGQVMHRPRGVGCTGRIGGGAGFNRALTAAELEKLGALHRLPPIAASLP